MKYLPLLFCPLLFGVTVSAQNHLYTFNGDLTQFGFGVSVSGVGDVNQDGHNDFIVGAWKEYTSNGFSLGSARVYSGKDGRVIYTFFGNHSGSVFGISVSGAGDVNQDGYVDCIVGASNDAANGALSGNARVFSGKDGAVLYTFNGDSVHDICLS